MALIQGTKLGTFEIKGLLGKGGMGEVCCVRDIKLVKIGDVVSVQRIRRTTNNRHTDFGKLSGSK